MGCAWLLTGAARSDLCQRTKTDDTDHLSFPDCGARPASATDMRTRQGIMSEAQLGLLTATPILVIFAFSLRAMGALSTTAAVSASSLSVAIAVVLFLTQ